MKILHILFAVFLAAIMMTIARDPVGRVALIVFLTGLGVLGLATASLMLLFRALSAIGSAESTVPTWKLRARRRACSSWVQLDALRPVVRLRPPQQGRPLTAGRSDHILHEGP